MELREARGEELLRAEELWQATFGDDSKFQRLFYQGSGLSAPLTLWEDGALRAMLALPTVTLTFGDGWTVGAGYVYALATAPEGRGRGYARQLLDFAAALLRRRGADCLLTVPARPELFDFFARCGFQPGFYHRVLEADPVPGEAEALTGAEYAALRETLLAGRTHVSHTGSQLEVQRALCPAAGSGLYRLTLPGGVGCAAVECWSHGPVVKELLCSPGDEEAGAACAAALCGGRATVRLPAGPQEGIPFAALRWLHNPPPPRWRADPQGWFGPAYD